MISNIDITQNYFAIYISSEDGMMNLVQSDESYQIVRYVGTKIIEVMNKTTKNYYERKKSVGEYLKSAKNKSVVYILSEDKTFPMVIFGKKEAVEYLKLNWENISHGTGKTVVRLKKRASGKDPVEKLKRKALFLLKEKKEDDLLFGYKGGYSKKEINEYLHNFYYFNVGKIKEISTVDEVRVWAKKIDEECGEHFEKALFA